MLCVGLNVVDDGVASLLFSSRSSATLDMVVVDLPSWLLSGFLTSPSESLTVKLVSILISCPGELPPLLLDTLILVSCNGVTVVDAVEVSVLEGISVVVVAFLVVR